MLWGWVTWWKKTQACAIPRPDRSHSSKISKSQSHQICSQIPGNIHSDIRFLTSILLVFCLCVVSYYACNLYSTKKTPFFSHTSEKVSNPCVFLPVLPGLLLLKHQNLVSRHLCLVPTQFIRNVLETWPIQIPTKFAWWNNEKTSEKHVFLQLHVTEIYLNDSIYRQTWKKAQGLQG